MFNKNCFWMMLISLESSIHTSPSNKNIMKNYYQMANEAQAMYKEI